MQEAPTPTEDADEALEQAQETGEEVMISTQAVDCNAHGKECNLDYITSYALPNGETEKRRVHTY